MASSFALDPKTTWFVIGLLYFVMPLTVWTVLVGRHDSRNAALWCGGAALSGATVILYAVRGGLPELLGVDIANALAFLGIAMRWAALRRERGGAVPLLWLLALVLLATAGVSAMHRVGDAQRIAFNVTANLLATAALAWEGRELGRRTGSRSAMMLAFAYALLCLALLIRLTAVLFDWGTGAGPAASTLGADTGLVLLASVLSALWGNLGYLGFAIEQAERRVVVRSAELAAVKALSDEREELLRVISHEARQPLHNAQAVLQGVDEALHGGLPASGTAAARITRARSVLRQITASLDNTLAASTLLIDAQRAASLRDTDIEMLVELCLGDLPPTERGRVDVEHPGHLRTAAIDVGLVRLALRNLLDNALAYATPGSRVLLRVSESDEPLALLIEVADAGPGIAPELLPRLFERGTRG
ncbi:MAG: HAMP domain-containing sensor histidine kinase, partial [Rubrivivax sp.]